MDTISNTTDFFNNIFSSVPLIIITAILGLDSIRAVLASLGIFDPDSRCGRIIYGKRDRTIVRAALRDLGYSEETSDEIVIKMCEIPERAFMANSGVSAEEAAIQLIIMLSRYIFEFRESILYGGDSLTESKYYIDTMEIAHNEADKQKLTAIMVHLLYWKMKNSKTPEIVITPKGGNPLLVQEIAANLNSHLVVAKSLTDKSRIRIAGKPSYSKDEFIVNYEGSWRLSESKKEKSCVVIDCNTSGGSQLLDIVKDIRMYVEKNMDSIKIKAPDNVFVLFRADTDGDNIDAKFSKHKCNIHRFFDLDEEAKAKMYRLKAEREKENKIPSYYSDEDIEAAKDIIRYLEEKGLYYYAKEKNKNDTFAGGKEGQEKNCKTAGTSKKMNRIIRTFKRCK